MKQWHLMMCLAPCLMAFAARAAAQGAEGSWSVPALFTPYAIPDAQWLYDGVDGKTEDTRDGEGAGSVVDAVDWMTVRCRTAEVRYLNKAVLSRVSCQDSVTGEERDMGGVFFIDDRGLYRLDRMPSDEGSIVSTTKNLQPIFPSRPRKSAWNQGGDNPSSGRMSSRPMRLADGASVTEWCERRESDIEGDHDEGELCFAETLGQTVVRTKSSLGGSTQRIERRLQLACPGGKCIRTDPAGVPAAESGSVAPGAKYGGTTIGAGAPSRGSQSATNRYAAIILGTAASCGFELATKPKRHLVFNEDCVDGSLLDPARFLRKFSNAPEAKAVLERLTTMIDLFARPPDDRHLKPEFDPQNALRSASYQYEALAGSPLMRPYRGKLSQAYSLCTSRIKAMDASDAAARDAKEKERNRQLVPGLVSRCEQVISEIKSNYDQIQRAAASGNTKATKQLSDRRTRLGNEYCSIQATLVGVIVGYDSDGMKTAASGVRAVARECIIWARCGN